MVAEIIEKWKLFFFFKSYKFEIRQRNFNNLNSYTIIMTNWTVHIDMNYSSCCENCTADNALISRFV